MADIGLPAQRVDEHIGKIGAADGEHRGRDIAGRRIKGPVGSHRIPPQDVLLREDSSNGILPEALTSTAAQGGRSAVADAIGGSRCASPFETASSRFSQMRLI
ncbi:hypothetical protein [Bradyrhizobium yuanmingense]|uniref:hypothetical protein n=1 Tax=Bradyrhizobium yuanmingense TaxID=108015 RepID=UPI003F6BFC87